VGDCLHVAPGGIGLVSCLGDALCRKCYIAAVPAAMFKLFDGGRTVIQDWTPEELQANLDAGRPVFLKLWKKGCGACKLSIPAIERLVATDTHGLAFGQISVDSHPEMLEIADTEVLPAFFLFRDKTMLGQLTGFKGLKSLQDFVAQGLSRP